MPVVLISSLPPCDYNIVKGLLNAKIMLYKDLSIAVQTFVNSQYFIGILIFIINEVHLTINLSEIRFLNVKCNLNQASRNTFGQRAVMLKIHATCQVQNKLIKLSTHFEVLNDLSPSTHKYAVWPMCPSQIQISLHICPVFSKPSPAK